MTEEQRKNHEYLGDAVYAEWNGEHYILRTGDYRDRLCEDIIYIDLSVMDALIKFKSRIESRINNGENNGKVCKIIK